jgi:hypothetical protein
VPFPKCRSAAIGLAIARNPENDGHLSSWQEAVGMRSSLTHTHTQERLRERGNDWRTARALRDAASGTLCSADRNAGERLAAHKRQEMVTTRRSSLKPGIVAPSVMSRKLAAYRRHN